MTRSFQNGDYDTYLDLIHPKIISLSGGRDEMKRMFNQGLGPGVEFINTELSLPDKLIVEDSIYQCSFFQKQIISINGQKMYSLGYLIGISYDLGETWKFIGVAGNHLANLQAHFLELSDELNVSPQTLPILIDD